MDGLPSPAEPPPGTRHRLPDLAAFALLAYAITWLLLGPWFYCFNRVWNRTIGQVRSR